MSTHQQLANAIRALSMDAVQKANSGHPGMPMGMADIATVLWRDFLNHNPADPHWINRDRFILSNGHGSMLLYALLHLSGYELSIAEIKNFRQLHSKTPGHPEFGLTLGVETTTGPLGQGLANAVGLALAERTLAAQFNQGEFDIINHYTYVFMGDGCLMEGISHEACSLAGTLGLSKLIGFWDNNGISIDGDVSGWFTDDTPKRFEAYGWHVIADVDGHDPEAIHAAIVSAQAETQRPSLICCKTQIGFGAPNLAGTETSHGAALGEEEVALARTKLGWQYPPFEIPAEIYAAWGAREKGGQVQQAWAAKWQRYQATHQHMAAEFSRRIAGKLPENWSALTQQLLTQKQAQTENIATRKASLQTLNAIGSILPELFGGSADLSGSNCTQWTGAKTINHAATDGNYLHYGVREFAMFAMMNGIALHGGFIPYGGTFLTFVDYGRNAVRLCAMMKQRVIFVLTHDSIGLGEDGPTHQPIEHLNMLRNTPNVTTWRPCDAAETAVAWQCAIEHTTGPSCLALSRGNLPAQQRDDQALHNIARGGYILIDCEQQPDAIIIATGSEVALAVQAAEHLNQQNVAVRVVSMPSTEVFARQDAAYINAVLPNRVSARLVIEAGATHFWYRYVGVNGGVIGLDRFGESAPAKAVFAALGFTVEHVVESVVALLAKTQAAISQPL